MVCWTLDSLVSPVFRWRTATAIVLDYTNLSNYRFLNDVSGRCASPYKGRVSECRNSAKSWLTLLTISTIVFIWLCTWMFSILMNCQRQLVDKYLRTDCKRVYTLFRNEKTKPATEYVFWGNFLFSLCVSISVLSKRSEIDRTSFPNFKQPKSDYCKTKKKKRLFFFSLPRFHSREEWLAAA